MFYYIKRKYCDIKCWCRYNLNKHHWKVIKSAIKGYPFDFCYMWDLEKAKLEEMLNYFKHGNIILPEDYEIIIRDIKLAIKLLDIIREEELTFSYEFNSSDDNKEVCGFDYECLVNVNTNNAYRFMNTHTNELEYAINRMPHLVYIAKAKHLYYKLMEYKIEHWWD